MKCLDFHTTEHVQCATRIKPHLWIYGFSILKEEKGNRQIVHTVNSPRNSDKNFTLRGHLKSEVRIFFFLNVVIGPWLQGPSHFIKRKKGTKKPKPNQNQQLYANRVMKKKIYSESLNSDMKE